MIIQLLNKKGEQVKFFEEDESQLPEDLSYIYSWQGKFYTYHDGSYNDEWGEYHQYIETDVRAVPASIEVG